MEYEKDFLTGMYQDLLKTRMTEEKMVDLYAQGIIPGHIHSGVGQEGGHVAVLKTFEKGDYIKFAHRVVGVIPLTGEPLDEYFGELLGKVTGPAKGRGGVLHLGRLQDGVVGMSGTLGCDASISVGAALTISMEGRNNVSYFIYGDGTSNRGPVHEAMALASVWKLPVMFVLINNQFAISTPSSYSSVVANPGGDRAAAYGMKSEVVEGWDILGAYEGAKHLKEYIKGGNGPAILECKEYRWRGHFEGDQCTYRDKNLTDEYMKNKDCLKLFEDKLKAIGVLTDDIISKMREDYEKEMEVSLSRAIEAPQPEAQDIFDGLYA